MQIGSYYLISSPIQNFQENRSVKRHLNQQKFTGDLRKDFVISRVRKAIGDYGGSLMDFPLVDFAASVDMDLFQCASVAGKASLRSLRKFNFLVSNKFCCANFNS